MKYFKNESFPIDHEWSQWNLGAKLFTIRYSLLKPSKTITKAYKKMWKCKIIMEKFGRFCLFFPFLFFDSLHCVLLHRTIVHLNPFADRFLQSFLLRLGVLGRHLRVWNVDLGAVAFWEWVCWWWRHDDRWQRVHAFWLEADSCWSLVLAFEPLTSCDCWLPCNSRRSEQIVLEEFGLGKE